MDDLGEFDTQPESNLFMNSSKELLDCTPPSSDSQTQSQPFETPENKPPADLTKTSRRISFRSPIENRQKTHQGKTKKL